MSSWPWNTQRFSRFVSRDEARAVDWPHYYTGRECAHGHVAPRRTSDSKCLGCVGSRKRRRYQYGSDGSSKHTTSFRSERWAAHARGAKAYVSDVVCPRGHDSARSAKTGDCLLCMRLKSLAQGHNTRRNLRGKGQVPVWRVSSRIQDVYDHAMRLRAAGEDVVVDHIIPFTHPLVSGLHVHQNLQILTAEHNKDKHGHWATDWGADSDHCMFQRLWPTHTSVDDIPQYAQLG